MLGPSSERGDDFIEFKLAQFAWEEERWVLDFPASALFAIGFLGLAGLGSAVARLADTSDSRRSLVASSFVLGGGFGAASQLLWIGAKPIATSTRYCDCGLLAEEIMSRTMILETVGGIQTWLISGALALLAVGALLVATMPQRALPQWWRRLNVVIAALSVIGVLLALFDAYPLDVLLTLLIAGILLPIWAIWLARRPADFWTPSIR